MSTIQSPSTFDCQTTSLLRAGALASVWAEAPGETAPPSSLVTVAAQACHKLSISQAVQPARQQSCEDSFVSRQVQAG